MGRSGIFGAMLDEVAAAAAADVVDGVAEFAGAVVVDELIDGTVDSGTGTVDAADFPCDTSQGFVLICDVISCG